MIQVGDTVKVIGTTLAGDNTEKECITIGTICKVVNVDEDDEGKRYVQIEPIGISSHGYWYSEKDVEKGHMEWIRDEVI